MLLNLDEVLELQTRLAERNGAKIHMHDTCGGQYFTVETPCAETAELVRAFLAEKSLSVKFTEKLDAFTIIPGAAL